MQDQFPGHSTTLRRTFSKIGSCAYKNSASSRIKRSEVRDSVDLSHTTFNRVLNLQETVFRKASSFASTTIRMDAFLDRTRFLEGADFSDATSKGIFDARGALFGARTDWSRAVFEKSVSFRQITKEGKDYRTVFDGEADFTRAKIGGTAEFTGATFKGPVSFHRATITGGALFNPATFEGEADFTSARIDSYADFTGATFKKKASFASFTVTGNAIFGPDLGEGKPRPPTFEGEANFTSARIGGYADFRGATFKGPVSFHRATIAESAFFNPATFEGEADFTSAKIGGTAEFTGVVFGDQVNILGTTYNRFEGSWKSFLNRVPSLRSQPYKELERFFRREGDDSQADEVFYARLNKQGSSIAFLSNPLKWLADRFFRWFLGYGVSFSHLLGDLLVFLIVGLIVFHTPGSVIPKQVEKCSIHGSGKCGPDEIHRLQWMSAFWVSLNMLVPMVEVLAGSGWDPSHGYWLRYKDTRIGITYATYATVQRFVGWFVGLVALGRLSGILQRFAS